MMTDTEYQIAMVFILSLMGALLLTAVCLLISHRKPRQKSDTKQEYLRDEQDWRDE
jgi:hypothetical protein